MRRRALSGAAQAARNFSRSVARAFPQVRLPMCQSSFSRRGASPGSTLLWDGAASWTLAGGEPSTRSCSRAVFRVCHVPDLLAAAESFDRESTDRDASTSREPIAKWENVERKRRQRFDALPSGRGRSGEVPADVLRASRSPQSAFRVTGLAYHAWEHRLKERPLPAMPALDRLRRSNVANPGMSNPDVLATMADMSTLTAAFISMYCRHGTMTDAQNVLQSRALPWLQTVSSQLQSGSYVFPIVSQLEPSSLNVPKHDGTLYTAPQWWHKTVPEAMRMILEAVFEPTFLKSAHGFRPDKGCYSALKEVKYGFADIDYLMVGDLSHCMEDYSAAVLMNSIRKQIPDTAFLQLVDEVCKKDYVDLSTVSYKEVGLPQTTLLSPILCNIYLHGLDLWFQEIVQCLSVGGQGQAEETEGIYHVLDNRSRYAKGRLDDVKIWKSASLQGVRYVRYGNNFLLGVQGSQDDMEQMEVDLVRFIKTRLYLEFRNLQYNRVLASAPEKAYVVFLGAEIYVAPQISTPGLTPAAAEAGRLPNRPRLCVPARLLVKKLEENGFIDPERKRPRYAHRLVMWECHEIVKYYDVVMKLFCMYFTFADNYHCLTLLYDVLKQSCSLTLARKLGLKRMWHVHKRLERDLIVRDMEGVALASFERPRFERPPDPFRGRDVNPFIRIERPSRPKFPPARLGEAFLEPNFPMSKLQQTVQSMAWQSQ